MSHTLYPSLTATTIATSGGATINVRCGGSGPPLLLLHGYPQTHVMWHKVAPRLAEHFTLVLTDLRGYGDSVGPPPLTDGSNYSFREMARDQLEVMAALGHRQFMLAGHDRGARTAHRLVLDHPQAVTAVALLDIQPTHYAWNQMTVQQLRRAWHWMLMSQPHDIPEHLLTAASPQWLLDQFLRHGGDGSAFSPEAYSEYLRCLTPEAIAASCADYRAFATLDVEHHQRDCDAGRQISCPTLVLYGEKTYGPTDMTTIWGQYVEAPQCVMVPDTGHYLAEENPQATLDALLGFFSQAGRR